MTVNYHGGNAEIVCDGCGERRTTRFGAEPPDDMGSVCVEMPQRRGREYQICEACERKVTNAIDALMTWEE